MVKRYVFFESSGSQLTLQNEFNNCAKLRVTPPHPIQSFSHIHWPTFILGVSSFYVSLSKDTPPFSTLDLLKSKHIYKILNILNSNTLYYFTFLYILNHIVIYAMLQSFYYNRILRKNTLV